MKGQVEARTSQPTIMADANFGSFRIHNLPGVSNGLNSTQIPRKLILTHRCSLYVSTDLLNRYLIVLRPPRCFENLHRIIWE